LKVSTSWLSTAAVWLQRLVSFALALMSNLTYSGCVAEGRGKPLAWLHSEVKTPPFSKEARIEVGALLRRTLS
jgi:hypothetical protein